MGHLVVLRLDQFSVTDRTRNRPFEELEMQIKVRAYAPRDFSRKLRDTPNATPRRLFFNVKYLL